MLVEILALLVLISIATRIVKINKEWEKAVILRLGKYHRTASSGLFIVIPFLEQFGRLDTRVQTMDVDTQKIITSDSVTVRVNAIVFYKIMEDHPENAILKVNDWVEASTTLAQTTLRDIVGQSTLDKLLTKKNEIGESIKKILDKSTDDWSISVNAVEIKDVIIPDSMERAMAKEAEATREKRARVTKAEGELEASKKLKEAGEIISKNKNAILLRQLQTWQEIGAEQNSLIIVVPEGTPANSAFGMAPLVELMKKPAKPIKRGK